MGETSPGAGSHDGDEERVDWFGLPSPALVRAAGGLALGVAASVLGALILGEYQFEGWLPIVAGLLFGLVVAELAVEVGQRRTVPVALACGVSTAGGLVWAGWISAGEGLEQIPGGAWLAAALGCAAAIARVVVGRR